MNSEELIKKHEGFKTTPYRDTEGILTVGYGRNLEKGLSDNIINSMFAEDMISVKSDCLKFSFFNDLSRVRQAVVENMMFNMGYTRLKGFKKMLNALEMGDYEEAAVQMLDSKWSGQVGYRADQLHLMMLHNKW